MIVDVDRHGPFRLREAFLAPYRERPVPWGFGPLSQITFLRTYSRDGERWWQTCQRVIEGMFTVQRIYCLERGLPWAESERNSIAEHAYERLFEFKWTPPGRGLWIMGTRFMYERGGAALNNCGFVSTDALDADYAAPFLWVFRMSMLGVGVGFDTRGKGTVRIVKPEPGGEPCVIDDSREGWGTALAKLLAAYTGHGPLPSDWDTSRIRPQGTRLESFGGSASGPGPLRQMLRDLAALYDRYVGRQVDAELIVDTMDMIGRCVVAGGIRRSALIALGDVGDAQFLDLKRDTEKRDAYRWVANHSVVVSRDTDYEEAARRTVQDGEPGFFWLENARRYGRLADPPNDLDAGAQGTNPCVEQTLWDRELCCLVETYPAHHRSLDDYLDTLNIAIEYAKTVTLIPTQDPRTDAVMGRNRRVGCSMTGIVQAVNRHGLRPFLGWCDTAYHRVQELDRRLSRWLCVPRSIKTTSVKPSGTVSLLAGATPGVHWPYAPFYIRRMRVAEDHPVASLCRDAGYTVEPDAYSDNSLVIEFPVRAGHIVRSRRDVPVWEKTMLAAHMQRYWSDNQVSCTISFDPETEAAAIPRLLRAFEDQLKALAFFPETGHGYEQPPYEAITADTYRERTRNLKPIRGQIPHEHQLEARFCDGDSCTTA